MGYQMKKVWDCLLRIQSQRATEKGGPTAHVQSHMPNTLADGAKFLSCLNSFCRHSNRRR